MVQTLSMINYVFVRTLKTHLSVSQRQWCLLKKISDVCWEKWRLLRKVSYVCWEKSVIQTFQHWLKKQTNWLWPAIYTCICIYRNYLHFTGPLGMPVLSTNYVTFRKFFCKATIYCIIISLNLNDLCFQRNRKKMTNMYT